MLSTLFKFKYDCIAILRFTLHIYGNNNITYIKKKKKMIFNFKLRTNPIKIPVLLNSIMLKTFKKCIILNIY